MVIPPKYAVSMVVETMKKNTGRYLSLKFRFPKRVYWDNRGIWSRIRAIDRQIYLLYNVIDTGIN